MKMTVEVEKVTRISVGQSTLELKTEGEAIMIRDRLLELYPVIKPSLLIRFWGWVTSFQIRRK